MVSLDSCDKHLGRKKLIAPHPCLLNAIVRVARDSSQTDSSHSTLVTGRYSEAPKAQARESHDWETAVRELDNAVGKGREAIGCGAGGSLASYLAVRDGKVL